MSVKFNWTCPYCRYPQVVTDTNYHSTDWGIRVGENEFGEKFGTRTVAIACQNAECKRLHLQIALREGEWYGDNWYSGASTLQFWNLLPESSAKPQPDYIPEVLRADYIEACRIRTLSPKSSATLARRCLQGMIRDFCGISKKKRWRRRLPHYRSWSKRVRSLKALHLRASKELMTSGKLATSALIWRPISIS